MYVFGVILENVRRRSKFSGVRNKNNNNSESVRNEILIIAADQSKVELVIIVFSVYLCIVCDASSRLLEYFIFHGSELHFDGSACQNSNNHALNVEWLPKRDFEGSTRSTRQLSL